MQQQTTLVEEEVRVKLSIERRSIDYVPHAERHGKVWHLWPIWFSGNAQLATLAAGAIGMLFSAVLTSVIGTLPFLGPAYEDDSGKVDIHLTLSLTT